jgi:hypothetical protein
MPINIPALITNTGNDVSLFGANTVAPSGGVTTLNSLDGVLQLVPAAGTSGISVVSTALTNTISLTTAGQAQAPSSVTTAGVVSAGTFVGGGLGLTLPTTSTGRATVPQTWPPPSAIQGVNIVVGNTRIQAGNSSFSLGPTVPINFETPFSGNPAVYIQTYEPVAVLSEIIWVDPATITTSTVTINGQPAQFFAWLAIGPA